MIRVMLADDHEVVRAGFRMILEQDPDVRVVAEAADGAQAYAIVAREKPDILLMDISMPPGQSGLVACEKIAKDFPGTKVVILTMFAEPEYLFYTLRGGAAGYVLKNSTSEELIAAVHAVAEGGSYIHPKTVSYTHLEKNLDRITIAFAIIFMLSLIVLMIIYPHGTIAK